MKKMTWVLFFFLFGVLSTGFAQYNSTGCSTISSEAIPMDPQPSGGNSDYYGVKVMAENPVSQRITVLGYIHHDAGAPTTGRQFQLNIEQGQVEAHTTTDFFSITRWNNAVVTITSVTLCPNNDIVIAYAGVNIVFESDANILRFNSASDYNAVVDELELENENYNEAYDNAQDPNLTEDQLDALDEQNGFDEFKKLRDFEQLFQNFTSKRAEIEGLESAWLSSNFSATDPDDLDLTFDDAANTLFNGDYAIKIGSDVYQLTANGLVLNGVLQANLSNQMRSDKIGSGRRPAFTDYAVHLNTAVRNYASSFEALGPVCKSNKKIVQFGEFGNDRYKMKVAINSIAVRSGLKSKVVHFELKNGTWKRARAKMAVHVGGKVYNDNCSLSFITTLRNPTSGWKKRRQLKEAYHKCCEVWRTYPNEVAGSFETSVGHANTLPLNY